MRLRLLRLLARQELNVQELVAITGLSQPRVSKHLGILRQQEWVAQRREGTWSWYQACVPTLIPQGRVLFDQVLQLADSVADCAADDEGLAIALSARQAKARAFFSDMADRWETISRQYANSDLERGLIGALAEPGVKVLDVGTGTGALLPELVACGAWVVALDHSVPMLVKARGRCRGQEDQAVGFCAGEAGSLPLQSDSFDVVSGAMILHHAARPRQVIAEMARVTRPGGRVTVTSFVAHDQEWMREELAHQWLGFAQSELEYFYRSAGLEPTRWLQRGPQPAERNGSGHGASAPNWPDVFLISGVKIAENCGTSARQEGESE